jgi:hypothetical protein
MLKIPVRHQSETTFLCFRSSFVGCSDTDKCTKLDQKSTDLQSRFFGEVLQTIR